MASSSVAAARRRVSAPHISAKESAKVSAMPAAVNEIVEHGKNCLAAVQGQDPIAVAVGEDSRSVVDAAEDSYMGAALSVGTRCRREVNGSAGSFASVAVGTGAEAVSNVKEVPSIAIGYEPHAEAESGGVAISIGSVPDMDLSCQAGEDGYLIFVDTSEREPRIAVFKVDPDRGIGRIFPTIGAADGIRPALMWTA